MSIAKKNLYLAEKKSYYNFGHEHMRRYQIDIREKILKSLVSKFSIHLLKAVTTMLFGCL